MFYFKGSKTVSRTRRRRSEETPVNIRSSSKGRGQPVSVEDGAIVELEPRSEEAENNIKGEIT